MAVASCRAVATSLETSEQSYIEESMSSSHTENDELVSTSPAPSCSDSECSTASAPKFPVTQQEADEVERILAEEMSKLSLEEQEKILFDIHGIAQFDQEDPDDIARYLEQFDDEVRRTPGKASYEKAKYLNQSFTDDVNFRLMFLRSERFDIKLASLRYVKHFEVKESIFGSTEVLAREIRLADMTTEDMAVLDSGFIQALPTRDVAGRSIFFFAPMLLPKGTSLSSFARCSWFMYNTALNDEETQKNGVVGVTYNVGARARADPLSMVTETQRIREGIPKKFMGVHYCFEHEELRPFVTGLQLLLNKEVQPRFRPHFGTENIQFELQTYGIPTSDHPLQPHHSNLCLAWHRQWLQVRRIHEQSQGTINGIIVPRRFDVLFGRGRPTREHTGNLRAVHVVEILLPQYEKASKLGKTKLAGRVVDIIQESYGRFLKWEDHGWVEVENEVAREKVSHFFRHARSRKNGGKNETKAEENKEAAESIASSAKRSTPSPPAVPLEEEKDPVKTSKPRGETSSS